MSIPTAKLLTVLPKQKAKPAASVPGVVVELADGSVIRGRQYVAKGSHARITLAGGEVVEAPASMVRTVLCGATADRRCCRPNGRG